MAHVFSHQSRIYSVITERTTMNCEIFRSSHILFVFIGAVLFFQVANIPAEALQYGALWKGRHGTFGCLQRGHGPWCRGQSRLLAAGDAGSGRDDRKKGNANWRKPLIVPKDSLENTQAKMKTWREKEGMKSEDRQRMDRNWRTGRCKHKVSFEGAEVIRKLRFCGDYLAFGLVDGRLCLIRISTGEIIEK